MQESGSSCWAAPRQAAPEARDSNVRGWPRVLLAGIAIAHPKEVPMSRHLAWPLALALILPSLTFAHPHPHPGSDDDLGWILIDGERQSMSDMRDIDDIERLKDCYGDEVLCVREGDERYVITKPAYIERARMAARRVSENK